MPGSRVLAEPRTVTDLGDCYFYHTMDIPGFGHVDGEWDLRRGLRKYLGGVDLKGKSVLEIGTASGFLCFAMESLGARVTAFDLSENEEWDVVPFSGSDPEQRVSNRRAHMKKINNAFWLCHGAFHSRARVVYGTTYGIPEGIGMVDVTTFGSILLHLRDPFLALQSALRLTNETVIVTEPLWRWSSLPQILSGLLGPLMVFLPDFKKGRPADTWWALSPAVIKKMIGALGFEKARVIYHFQKFRGRRRLLFTVVGQRTHAG